MHEARKAPQDIRTAAFTIARTEVIRGIRSPLGFFALSLLIVEAFLLGAGFFYNLSPTMRVVALGVGVLLFLVVFGSVCWLVVKYPRNLVFSEGSHVQFAAMEFYGHRGNPVSGAALEALPPGEAPPPPKPQLPGNSEET